MDVTVCIPTYRRPAMLLEAIRSCLDQDDPPSRILIGDDSPDGLTEEAVSRLGREQVHTLIDYVHHVPALGQTENVQALIERVETEFMVLLHDDDLLMPGALAAMMAEFASGDVDACFGKQYQMQDDGTLQVELSDQVNRFYLKSRDHLALQLSPIEVALSQQFPNDGFLIRTELARRAGYRHPGSGDACDFAFSLALGRLGCRSRFIDVYTAAYRRTLVAVSNSGSDAALAMYRTAQDLQYAPSGRIDYRANLLDRQAAPAIAYATGSGHLSEARKIYWSRWHRRRILTPGGIKRGLLLAGASMRTRVRRPLGPE